MKAKRSIQPPRLADKFFHWYCRNELNEAILGDLHERFYQDLESGGLFKARLKYWLNTVRFINRHTLNRSAQPANSGANRAARVKSYFIATFRHLSKDSVYSLINISGLSLGLACTLAIALFVYSEYSYDKFHSKSDRIFRLEIDIKTGETVNHRVSSSPPMAPAMMNDFPEVENFLRLRKGDTGGGDLQFVAYGDQGFFEEIHYADSTLFDVFDFDLAVGNPANALVNPNSVVVSHQIAEKYFGSEDPLGKILSLDQQRSLEITGVLAPTESNSHLQFDFLLSMSGYTPYDFAGMNAWGWTTFYSYIVLKDNNQAESVEDKMPELISKYWREDLNERLTFRLMPLEDIYLHTNSDTTPIGKTSSAQYSTILLIVGMIILVTSCFNYINLATARSLKRSKEVGIRKVMGALKGNIRFQFIAESVFLICISGLLALLFVWFGSLFFRDRLDVDIFNVPIDYFAGGFVYFMFLLLIGLLAGVYPSFVLAGFRPIETFKGGGNLNIRSGRLMRNTLLVFQFLMAIVLITATLIVNEQLTFLHHKYLGFEKEKVVILELRGEDLLGSYPKLRNELLTNPNVINVGGARLGLEGLHGSYRVISLEENADPEGFQMAIYPVNYDFFETLGMNLIDGRSYSRDYHVNDTTFQFVINQEAAKILGWSNPVGRKIMLNGQGGMYGEIVGVVQNFHFKTLGESIEPLVTFLRENAGNYVYIRLGGGDHGQQLISIEDNWNAVNPEYPFEYQFLDDRINNIYEADAKFSFLISFFSAIALIITVIGLLGMVAFITSQRIREISIRKVLGASAINVVTLLLAGFVKLVLIAFVVAIPFSYVGVNEWLNSYAYRIEPGPWVYLLAGILLLLVVLLTSTLQTLKVSLLNPVRFLRNE